MKKVRKNATVQMERIIKGAATVNYYCKANDYKGGFFKQLDQKEIDFIIDNIKDGHAVMYDMEDGRHTIHYAKPMKIVLTK